MSETLTCGYSPGMSNGVIIFIVVALVLILLVLADVIQFT